jgi:gamma-glutamyltranspeptidase / glutathione hydrolase
MQIRLDTDAFAVIAVGALMLGSAAAAQDHSAAFERHAVAADHWQASEAGAKILRMGGNAVDAAVATSLALSVVRPASCGIGGGGFMVIVLPDDPKHGRVVTAINYRETGPSAVNEDFYEQRANEASLYGGAAVGVPGTVAGLSYAQQRYGLLEWAQVVQPAIELAEHGFEADRFHVSTLGVLSARAGVRAQLLGPLPDGFLAADEHGVVRNPAHARALRLIAEHGASAFYEGVIADAIVRATSTSGGVITREDLRGYAPVEVQPLKFEFAGRTVYTMPPPSSGGIAMLQTLGIYERAAQRLGVAEGPWASASGMHVLVEATKHAFADRSRWLADPAFAPVPIERLSSGEYLDALASRVSLDGVLESSEYGSDVFEGAAHEDGGTSHLSVVDQWGGAVACTETINTVYGSLVVVPEFGFVLNNEMDDFQARRGTVNAFGLVQSDWNLPNAGKRPLSSMTPTVVVDADGRVEVVAGAAGGPRIITGTTQVVLRMLMGQHAGEAINAARMHHQWMPDRLTIEQADEPMLEALRAMGHDASARGHESAAQAIGRGEGGEGWEAASDPRKGGRPAGD